MATDGLAKPTATTAIEEGREETATNFQVDAKAVTSSVVGAQSSQSQLTPRTSILRLPNSLQISVSLRAIFPRNELGTTELNELEEYSKGAACMECSWHMAMWSWTSLPNC